MIRGAHYRCGRFNCASDASNSDSDDDGDSSGAIGATIVGGDAAGAGCGRPARCQVR